MDANTARKIAGVNDLICMSNRNRESIVWLGPENKVYKHSPKCLIDVEYYFLSALAMSGYVPKPVHRIHDELIQMPFIVAERVTRPDLFMFHLEPVLDALRYADCRHGDLTEYSVLVSGNRPVIIDFGEARYWHSPFPDKRREGDRYWLEKTMKGYVARSFAPEMDL